jgi:hypothetical protein
LAIIVGILAGLALIVVFISFLRKSCKAPHYMEITVLAFIQDRHLVVVWF